METKSFMTEKAVEGVRKELMTKAEIKLGYRKPLSTEEKEALVNEIIPAIHDDAEVEAIDSINYFESYALVTVKLSDKRGFVLCGFDYADIKAGKYSIKNTE